MTLHIPTHLLGHITAAPSYQDSGRLFWATCVAIVLLLVWGKLASYFNGQTGTIASIPGGGGCRPHAVSISVRLWSGRLVEAAIDGCLLCSLELTAGDRVWLADSADGYVVIRAKGQSLRRLLRDVVVDPSTDCLRKRGT